jgi:hypothetical protein
MLKSGSLSGDGAAEFGAVEDLAPFTWVARLTIPLAALGLLGVIVPVYRVASGSSALPLHPGTEFRVDGAYVAGYVQGRIQRIRRELGLPYLGRDRAGEARRAATVHGEAPDAESFGRGFADAHRGAPPPTATPVGPALATEERLAGVFDDIDARDDPEALYDAWQYLVSLAGWLKSQGASEGDLAWYQKRTRGLLDRVIALDPGNVAARESRGDLLYEGELAGLLERDDLDPSERERIEALERLLVRRAAEGGGWIEGEDVRRLEALLERYDGR